MADVKGLQKVLRNIDKELEKIENKTLEGFIEAASLVRRSMDRTSPKIPVDTGNMRASWFVVTTKGNTEQGEMPKFEKEGSWGDTRDVQKLYVDHQKIMNRYKLKMSTGQDIDLGVAMGFTAYYTPYVHEKTDANFRRPGSGAKFFEQAFRQNKKGIIKIIQKKAHV